MKNNMINQKGASVVALFVIIIIMVSAWVLIQSIGPITRASMETEVSCPLFCDIHSGVEEYSRWAWWPGWLGGSVSWSDIFTNELRKNMVEPKSMGCYCGVQEERGKFIHFQGTTSSLYEFHMTDQDPLMHLRMKADPFDHRPSDESTVESCRLVVENYGEQFSPPVYDPTDLHKVQGCIIVSESPGCAVWVFGEGFSIRRDSENSIWEQAQEQERDIEAFSIDRGEDPVSDLNIGETIHVSSSKDPSQRMLLREYESGDRDFNLSTSVVCKSIETAKTMPTDQLDRACNEYCSDKGLFFLNSACLQEKRRGYNTLPEEYIEQERSDLCPETGELPFCLCAGEKEYYWETYWEDFYTITVETQGSGTVDINPDLDEYYRGQGVLLEAEADNEWEFSHWEGNYPTGQKEDSEITITVDGNMVLSAVFESEH